MGIKNVFAARLGPDDVGEDEAALTDFECLGKQPLAGKDVLAYQGENQDPEEKKDPADKDKPKQLSAYKLAQMQGSSGSPYSTPPGKKP